MVIKLPDDSSIDTDTIWLHKAAKSENGQYILQMYLRIETNFPSLEIVCKDEQEAIDYCLKLDVARGLRSVDFESEEAGSLEKSW